MVSGHCWMRLSLSRVNDMIVSVNCLQKRKIEKIKHSALFSVENQVECAYSLDSSIE